MKQRILRALVAVVLVTLVLVRIDVPGLLSILSGINLRLYLLSFGIVVVASALRAFRWHNLYRTVAPTAKYTQTLKLHYEALSAGLLLPGTIGNDAFRVGGAARDQGTYGYPAGTVLFDRIAGLLGLFALAGSSLIVNAGLLGDAVLVTLLRLTVVGAVLLALLVFFPGIFREPARRVVGAMSRYGHSRTSKFARKVFQAVSMISANRLLGLFTVGVSVVLHLLAIGGNVVVAIALDVVFDYSLFISLQPLVMMVAMIPVSVSGIGLREWSVVGLYGLAGIPAEQILAVSLASFALVLPNAAIGAVIYALERRGPGGIPGRKAP